LEKGGGKEMGDKKKLENSGKAKKKRGESGSTKGTTSKEKTQKPGGGSME